MQDCRIIYLPKLFSLEISIQACNQHLLIASLCSLQAKCMETVEKLSFINSNHLQQPHLAESNSLILYREKDMQEYPFVRALR